MQFAKSSTTPMTSGLKLSLMEVIRESRRLYRSIVGALQYVCQFMQNPLESQWKAVKRILRYLSETLDCGYILEDHLNELGGILSILCREKVLQKKVLVQHGPSINQIARCFDKAHFHFKFPLLSNKLKVEDLATPSLRGPLFYFNPKSCFPLFYAIGNPFGLDHTLTTWCYRWALEEIGSAATGHPIQDCIFGVGYSIPVDTITIGSKRVLVYAHASGPAKACLLPTKRDAYGRLILGDIITSVNGKSGDTVWFLQPIRYIIISTFVILLWFSTFHPTTVITNNDVLQN
ncbi:hypothetical protein AAG906_026747 [Vitis piasezkii]